MAYALSTRHAAALLAGGCLQGTWGGQTPLMAAIAADNLDCVRVLVEVGADVNATDWVSEGWHL